MELSQYQNETYANNPPGNLVQKICYQELGIRTEVPEPVTWNRRNEASIPKTALNWEISTVPPVMYLLATLAYNS